MTCKECVHYEACKNIFQIAFKDFTNYTFVKVCELYKSTADVAEVVMCKDCRSWDEGGFDPIMNHRFGYCRHYQWQDDELCDRETNDNDFCSYGEKALKERERE